MHWLLMTVATCTHGVAMVMDSLEMTPLPIEVFLFIIKKHTGILIIMKINRIWTTL